MRGNPAAVWRRLNEDFADVTKRGHKVLGVFLQGSQNYDLDYDGSDIDTKAIVLPTFADIVLNRQPVSTTIVRPDNAHVDLKDIRLMWQCFKKQNINFLEILFTDYFVVSKEFEEDWNRMREHAEEIAHYNNYAAINCIAGMVFEKEAALCHPYPSLKDKIDKYGYDNKQLHHIFRCREFLERYIEGVPYADCLVPTNPESLIEVKSNYIYNVDDAKLIAKKLVSIVKEVKQNYMDTHPVVVNDKAEALMQEILLSVLSKSLRSDLNS